MTVRKQQGRLMKRENGEGEMERCDMRTANTLSHACTRCRHAAQGKMCQKNARATRSVSTKRWALISGAAAFQTPTPKVCHSPYGGK